MLRFASILTIAIGLAAASGQPRAQQSDYSIAQQRVTERNQAGDFQGALTWAEKMLAIAEREDGPQSAAAASALLSIAIQQQSLGRLERAEEHYRRGLAIQERLVPADDPALGPFMGGLGGMLFGQGRYEDAEPYMRTAVRLQEVTARRSGDESGLAVALFLLGSNYTSMSRLDEGYRLLDRALAVFARLQPQGGLQTAIVLNNLATNRQFANDYAAATDFQGRALALFQKFAPENQYGIAKINNNLGFLFQRAGDVERAIGHYKTAIAQLEKAFPAGHADIATANINYAGLLLELNRLDEAEPLLDSGLATRKRWLPADHPEIALAHSELANLFIRRAQWQQAAAALRASASIYVTRAARQVTGRGSGARNDVAENSFAFVELVKAQYRVEPRDLDQAFIMAQHAAGSSAAASLAQMATRSAKGDPQLSALVRSRQDLVTEWQALDKELVAALASSDPHSGTAEPIRQRLAVMDARITDLDREIAAKFPEFTALANPAPLSVAEVQASLSPDEALILFLDTPSHQGMPEETFIFVVTTSSRLWLHSDLGTAALAREVEALRCGLDFTGAWLVEGSRCAELTGTTYTREDERVGKPLPFDAMRAHNLYASLLGGAADLIAGKRLLVVPSGSLSKLPFQVLVTEKLASEKRADFTRVAWLARSNAITVLPAASSLKALRQNAKQSAASEPFLGFGNPVLTGDCGPVQIPESCPEEPVRVASAVAQAPHARAVGTTASAGRYFRNGTGDVAALRQLCPLPDTVHELKCVAKSLGASESSLRLGPEMTEAALKKTALDRYRVLHFATHGLLAGEMATLSRAHAEPALVMTPPDTPTEEDDGLLTASEIASLKLDAGWVIMSACNTAAAGAESAEALSGLARAFFYAGARTLLASHWPVNSYAATMLTSSSFAEMRRDPKIGRAEAFRRAMLALLDDRTRPWAAHPSVWAPFVLVGEGGAGR